MKVKSGYLALRNAKAYDDANEIGQLNTGDTVQVGFQWKYLLVCIFFQTWKERLCK